MAKDIYSYVMGAGSMIGVYAFHDIIPWDDDINIWVDYRDLPKVKRVLRNPSLRQSYGAQAYWNDRFSREYDLKILMEFPENARDEDLNSLETMHWVLTIFHGGIHLLTYHIFGKMGLTCGITSRCVPGLSHYLRNCFTP